MALARSGLTRDGQGRHPNKFVQSPTDARARDRALSACTVRHQTARFYLSNPDAPLYLHVFSIFSTTFKHSKSSSTTSTLKSSGKFFDSTIVPLTGAPMAAKDARACAEAIFAPSSSTPLVGFRLTLHKPSSGTSKSQLSGSPRSMTG